LIPLVLNWKETPSEVRRPRRFNTAGSNQLTFNNFGLMKMQAREQLVRKEVFAGQSGHVFGKVSK
jgi:hypothetical protein